jgi:cyclin H
MVDFPDSTQLQAWSFGKNEHLSWCRTRANHAARELLSSEAAATTIVINPTAASSFAQGWSQRLAAGEEKAEDYESDDAKYRSQGPWENAKGKAFLNATEEATLVSFYAPKLGTLIGPKSEVEKLRRESKVTATAALLYRRFFLSNSVMLYDPKSIMVASAFLASKVRAEWIR